MEEPNNRSEFVVDDEHHSWLPQATLRFGYLYPQIEVVVDGSIVRFAGAGAEDPALKREFKFCLYRQKIFEQTLPLRKTLIEGVTGLAGRSS